ncbi:MAG TPA: PSD1 and planctomycete cytochrome C domain-containing protein [Candidatus Solibacter sp.]|nr:PSD1 and planctomycete cytochrome C domain-containing protein [Candidatus Solibacter sp.]
MRLAWGILLHLACGWAALHAADKPVSFATDIRPIFESSCWKCHGGSVQLSKLDLRTRGAALQGGQRGAAIVPGKATESRLYRVVAGLEKPSMPLDGKLSAGQISIIKDWIEQGALWDVDSASARDGRPESGSLAALEEMLIPPEVRKYWAFQKPSRVPLPQLHTDFTHPIDVFLEKVRAEKGLKAAPRADRNTLLRRAYMDLIGLPPSPAETAAFLADESPHAWETVIERLLASPHYGERWGRHWLDVARYADSNGFEHDFDRPNAWRYRDYVIRAFNQDKPYNTFLAEQIAGDELDAVTDDSMIATGFLRCYAKVGYREKDNPNNRFEYLDDMIGTIGRGVLGLTVNCARCHNHKFDPISQKDYYRMEASLFGYVETEYPLAPKAQVEAYEKKTAEIDSQVAGLRQAIRGIEEPYRQRLAQEKYKKYPPNVQRAIAIPPDRRTPGEALLAEQVIRTTSVSSAEVDRILAAAELSRKRELNERIRNLEAQRPKALPSASIVTDGDYRFAPDGPGDEPAPGKGVKRDLADGSFLFTGPGRYQPPPSYFLIRGDPESRGSLMRPGFIDVITYGDPKVEDPPANGRTSGRRRALAAWLGSTENPLTARVIVNRIWSHHFGTGIVPSLNNFGKMGQPPTHPELLDWLAVEFMERGWSVKQMHRLIMTSEAYRMSSQNLDSTAADTDPENHSLWRFPIQRLDAEIVRDAIMAVSGALDLKMGGPPVFPHIPGEILASMSGGIWKREEDGPPSWRRSVYVYRKRGLVFPMFEVFDLPDQNTTCGRRNVSTVPTQALALMNDAFVVRQARLFADRVKEAAPEDSARQIDLAYRIALSRPPREDEAALAAEFLRKRTLADFAHVLLNLNEFLYVR